MEWAAPWRIQLLAMAKGLQTGDTVIIDWEARCRADLCRVGSKIMFLKSPSSQMLWLNTSEQALRKSLWYDGEWRTSHGNTTYRQGGLRKDKKLHFSELNLKAYISEKQKARIPGREHVPCRVSNKTANQILEVIYLTQEKQMGQSWKKREAEETH